MLKIALTSGTILINNVLMLNFVGFFCKLQVQYLIKWEGYNEAENTWEPAENLDCDELVKEFEANRKKSQDKDRRITKDVEKSSGEKERKKRETSVDSDAVTVSGEIHFKWTVNAKRNDACTDMTVVKTHCHLWNEMSVPDESNE